MLSPHDFFYGVIGDVVEEGGKGWQTFPLGAPARLAGANVGRGIGALYRIIPYHMGPPPSDYHDKWGRHMPYTVWL